MVLCPLSQLPKPHLPGAQQHEEVKYDGVLKLILGVCIYC